MKKYRMLMVLAAICLVAFSCGQPKASTDAVKPAAKPAAPATAPPAAEEQADVGEEEETAEATEEAVAPVEAAKASETDEAVETPVSRRYPAAKAAADDAPAESAGEQAVEGGTPKLVVPEPTYDFGAMRDTEKVTHHFVLRNEGTGVLKITNVRASCGCTTTELEKDTLEPDEEIKIGAVTNLRGRQGPQTKVVTVATNDPETPTVQLRMVGTVLASIAVEPDRINFGEIRDDEPREASVNIKSTVDDVTFTVLSAELTGMDFIEHEIKTVEEGKSYDLIIRTKGELPPGHHNGRMIIRTDSQERSVIWLSISLQVVGPLQIMPPVIHIRYNEKPGEVTSQQLRISPGRITEFEILEVVAPLEDITATLTPSGDNVYLLRLENMPCSDALEDKAIILRTNLEEYPEIEIPFNIARVRVPTRPAGVMPRAPIQLTPEQKEQLRQRKGPVSAKDAEGEAPKEE
ncbi:MAG TPA: DUF1573 domain-containing protein [Candidatus Hydrogenedentes bacterium]|nr:DUF1573 domain-containing protein [Candidatus Hydrogenedentota bacterium]